MELEQQLAYCNRCGLCLAVCPTYWDSGVETQSPRGRLALIQALQRGELSPSNGLWEHLYHCLDCRACQTVCPSGVKVGEQVVATRGQASKGLSFANSLFLKELLPHLQRMEFSLWPLRIYQNSGLQALMRRLRFLQLLPGPWDRWDALLPSLSEPPLRPTLPEITPPRGEKRYRVGFLLGCFMSLFFGRASRATVRVLAENGCEVVTPREQKCCGAPHHSQGDNETLIKLAQQNIAAFEKAGVEVIVTDCAACGAMAKEYGQLLASDPLWGKRAMVHSCKVMDVSQFLMQIPLNENFGKIQRRVTYHDPCHLVHAQGVSQQPRDLLRAIPDLELVEMAEANWCCGGAGAYGLTHWERSTRILERKMTNIAATAAEAVVTANPGCLLQLELGARRYPMKLQVVHLTELLDEAYVAGHKDP
ncbi:MAG: (Fe-S)-binding protein [Chloroflexi bacterium]|nr:(Fe-S)-binding protein [Chloroflexota bacterium]